MKLLACGHFSLCCGLHVLSGLRVRISWHILILLVTQYCDCQEKLEDQLHTATNRIGVLYSNATRTCFSEERIRSTLSPVMDGPILDVLWRAVNHTSSVLVTRDVCDLVEAGVRGLITVLPYTQQTMVISQAEALHLPNLVIDLRPFRPPLGRNFSVQLNPSSAINIQMVKDILSAVDWTTVALVFDDVMDATQREKLLRQLQAHLIHMHVFSVALTSRNFIRVSPSMPLFPGPNRHLIYFGRGETWKSLVKQSPDLLSEAYSWIVISDVTSQEALVIMKAGVHANVVFVTEKWREYTCMEEPWREQVDTNHAVPHNLNSSTMLQELLIDSLKFYTQSLPSHNTSEDNTRESCSTFQPNPLPNHHAISLRKMLGIYSQLASMQRAAHMDYEILSYFYNNNGMISRRGEWSVANGLLTEKKALFLNEFHEFGTEPIMVAATEDPPYIIEGREEGQVSYTGFSIDILNELAFHMAFNYTIIKPPDDAYGAPDENGTWNGMVGMVYRGEAKMAIGPISITSLRERIIDFTIPFMDGSTGIMTLSPGYGANKSLFQTLKPYSVSVWICVLCSVFLVGVTSFFINRLTPFQRKREFRPFQAKYESSLEDNMWMVYSSVTEQGVEHTPEAVSGRCLIGFWWLFTTLLVATYTANLAAFFTVSLPPAPINSLGELVAQDEIQPVFLLGSSFETTFKESKSELYQKVWKRVQQSPRVSLMSELNELVMTGKYARLADKPTLEYIASNSCYAFSVATQSFDPVGYGMVLPQGAPYLRTVNHLIMKMLEAGLIENWKQKWWKPTSQCSDLRDDTANSLGLESVGGLFLSYVGIIVLSVVCLVLDLTVHNFREDSQQFCDRAF